MFLEGIINQIEVFAAQAAVPTTDVLIRFVFSDGDFVAARGLRVVQPFGGGNWGMVIINAIGTPEAVVIREADIYKVQLEVAARGKPIGFAAEGARAG